MRSVFIAVLLLQSMPISIAEGISVKSVRKSFCNTFSGQEWGPEYDLTSVDFASNCAFCAKRMAGCPMSDLFIRPTLGLGNPLCCIVKSTCSCPPGTTQTSCTVNALENSIPIFNLFADSNSQWVDAWQQYWASLTSKVVLSSTAVVRVLTETRHRYKVSELMAARKVMDDALGPFRAFPQFKDAAFISTIIQHAETVISWTGELKKDLEDLKNILEELGQVQEIVDDLSAQEIIAFCNKSASYRSVRTGRLVKAPSTEEFSPNLVKIVKELMDKGREYILDKLISSVIKDEDLQDVLKTWVEDLRSGVSALDMVAMSVSGTHYVAKSVKKYASKLSSLASEIADQDWVVSALSIANPVLDAFMGAWAVEQIASGIYEDMEGTCGCCASSDSALIDLLPSSRDRALYVQKESFNIVYPPWPWEALNAVNTAPFCSLAFKFGDLVLAERQEQTTRATVLQGVSLFPSNPDSCVLNTYTKLSDWAIDEAHAEVKAYNEIAEAGWEVHAEMKQVEEQCKQAEQLANEWCFFFCYERNAKIASIMQRALEELRRIHYEAVSILLKQLDALLRADESLRFFKALEDMNSMFGDRVPPLPVMDLEMMPLPSELDLKAKCFGRTIDIRIPAVRLHATIGKHVLAAFSVGVVLATLGGFALLFRTRGRWRSNEFRYHDDYGKLPADE